MHAMQSMPCTAVFALKHAALVLDVEHSACTQLVDLGVEEVGPLQGFVVSGYLGFWRRRFRASISAGLSIIGVAQVGGGRRRESRQEAARHCQHKSKQRDASL
jgi:hypothetical protein